MRKTGDRRIIPDHPDRVSSYFFLHKRLLIATAVTGIACNLGELCRPWFEGQLTGCLLDVLAGRKFFRDMLWLAIAFVVLMAVFQVARYGKRFFVRHFGNELRRSMKDVLYGNLVHRSVGDLEGEDVGDIMTKAVADADASAEGMRKVTTEVFDTGVAMVGYICMLLAYDWRLALISLVTPPVTYAIATCVRSRVQRASAENKESYSSLSNASLDLAQGAITYRIYGCEAERAASYERHLADYERKAVRADAWTSVTPPLYKIISMAGVLPIIFLGARNLGPDGWSAWGIAQFTTFLSCYTKLASKSSRSANLFNAVQRAEVSWRRIKPQLQPVADDADIVPARPAVLTAKGLTFAYPGREPLFKDLSFTASPGEIIGVTGPVASGKSSFGRVFLSEWPYTGEIEYGGMPVLSPASVFGYMGHDTELLSDTVANNIAMGDDIDVERYLRAVELWDEVYAMPLGTDTLIGNGGVRLSGGQQARLALARTLAHPRPVYILDDPFAALDRETETAIFKNLRGLSAGSSVILISHRLYHFSECDRVIWIGPDARTEVGTHEELISCNEAYKELYYSEVSS